MKDVPVWCNVTSSRVLQDIPILLPLEALNDAYEACPQSFDPKLQDPADVMTKHFVEHPLCKQFGALNCVGLRIYSDKVPVFKKD